MTRALAICCLLLATSVREAAAEWQFTPMVGLTMFGRTSIVDTRSATDNRHLNLGGSVALLSAGLVGAEVMAIWTPGFFETDEPFVTGPDGLPGLRVSGSRAISLMGNVVLTAPRRWTEFSLRPFVSGGVGLMHVRKVDEGIFTISSNLPGFNIGGGAIGFLTDRTGLRFDVRFHSTLNGSDEGPVSFGDVNLRYVTATIGLVFRSSPVR